MPRWNLEKKPLIKINFDSIVFDLEMTSNQVTADVRPEFQENNYIIDIGAVALNRDLEIVSQFQSLVKPEEPITPFIQEMTGISNEMVAGEDLWSIVALHFEAWVSAMSRNDNLKQARLCAWGPYFDIKVLRAVYRKYNRFYPFNGTAFGVETLSMAWHALSGRNNSSISVGSTAKEMGIEPIGKYHRALVDADTTAKIMQRVFKDLDTSVFLDPKIAGRPHRHLKITEE
jgi:DNA polymerase III epsilon subunit-like protein